MALARRGSGLRADAAVLASQVHPVFMLPPVAAAGFGGLLSARYAVWPAALHAGAVVVGLYTAHVKDGYVDFHVRDEDEDHPMTARGCRAVLAASTLAFWALVAALWVAVSPGAAALAAPGWLLGYFHAPQLDTGPLGATLGYPLGVALALLGGFYAQAGRLDPAVVAFAAVLLVVVAGIKVVDDAQDYDYDRSVDKRTVAVVLGVPGARRVANALLASGVLAVAGLAAVGVFPRASALAGVAFGAVALLARPAAPRRATMLLVRGAYLFLAVLLATTWPWVRAGGP